MYCIAHPSGTKAPRLYKVKTNGGKMLAVQANNQMWSNDTIELRHKEIIVNLGENPPLGSCYGVWVEPVLKRVTVKGYGDVFLYLELEAQAEARVLKALPAALERVRKLGPTCDWEYATEIRNPKGTTLGTYRYKANGSDTLTLHLQNGQGTREMVKVIAHELGHGIWFRHLSAEDRVMWISAYEKFVMVKEVSPKDVKNMLRDMRQIGSVKDYIKDAAPEEQAAADVFLLWLKKVHSITKFELQDLITAGGEIPAPNTHIHRSDISPPITVYSKTNPSEYFCEAISCSVIGDLADVKTEKLLRKLRG